MGCGASKGTEVVVPTHTAKKTGLVSGAEFTPDSKPGLAGQPTQADVAARAKETREAAKRVDDIVKAEVAEFDDDTVTKQDKPDGPLQVAPVPTLPPPPATPPAAAQRSPYQASDTTGAALDVPRSQGLDPDPGDASYFPTQVSLNVVTGNRGAGPSGGAAASGGLFSQVSAPTPEAASVTSLQRFSGSAMPSQPLSSVTLQTLPLQKQQSSQQPQAAAQGQLPPLPLQSRPQPLSESGPSPGAGPSSGRASASTVAAAPPGDDPWSSLQSQYRIRETDRTAVTGSPDLGSNRGRGDTGGRIAGDTGGPKEVLVLGEDDEFGGGARSSMNNTMNRTARGGAALIQPPPRPGAQPKTGGWGSGQMARAGELMIGEDDWLEADKPPGTSFTVQLPPPRPGKVQSRGVVSSQAVVSCTSGKARADSEFDERHPPVALKGPKVKPREQASVMCEDIEDVDTLLEDELQRQGLSDRNLASKLAAYETQFKDDDD